MPRLCTLELLRMMDSRVGKAKWQPSPWKQSAHHHNDSQQEHRDNQNELSHEDLYKLLINDDDSC